MKPIIKDIREVSDSKEMYETRPHPFLSIFIYILLACILCAGIWMYYGEMDVVSKGTGIVRPNENISMIRNKVQGEVTSCKLEEGKQVKKGEILFTIGYDNLEIKKLQILEILEETKNHLKQLKRLRDSIEQDKNLFSQITEKEYYDRYEKYKKDYEALKNEVQIKAKTESIETSQTQINQSIYNDKIKECEEELKRLEDFKRSIEDKSNVFEDKSCSEALEFNTYLFKVKELENTIENKKVAYNLNVLLDEQNLVSKQDLKISKEDFELAENELNKLHIAISKDIEKRTKELEQAKQAAMYESSKLIIDEGLVNTNKKQRALSIEKYRTDTLVPLYNQIDEIELAYKSKKRELESAELNIADCTVKAPIDGRVNIVQKISKGDLIGAGTDIATIIPANDNMYKVEVFMPNREIAGLKKGDIIKYKFDALPYKEYGELKGEIINISTDAKVSNDQDVSGYYVQGSVENKPIYSYKNEPAEIKVGMTCEAHVITEQKKILHYLLEKINLMD